MGGIFGKLYSKWYCAKETRILMIGLDAAGKTTMFYKLKLGEVVTTIPTIGFNVETIDYKNVKFTAWDVGLRSKSRALIRHYYPNTDAVLFVLDSSDRERIEEVKELMSEVLREDELRDAIVLVVANKQDVPNALSVSQLIEKLDLYSIKNHNWNIVPAVATTGDGLYNGLDWLVENIGKKHVKNSMKESVQTVTESTTNLVKKNTGFNALLAGIGCIKNKLWWASHSETQEAVS